MKPHKKQALPTKKTTRKRAKTTVLTVKGNSVAETEKWKKNTHNSNQCRMLQQYAEKGKEKRKKNGTKK